MAWLKVNNDEHHDIRLETSKPFCGESRFLIGHAAIAPHRLAAVVRFWIYLQKLRKGQLLLLRAAATTVRVAWVSTIRRESTRGERAEILISTKI